MNEQLDYKIFLSFTASSIFESGNKKLEEDNSEGAVRSYALAKYFWAKDSEKECVEMCDKYIDRYNYEQDVDFLNNWAERKVEFLLELYKNPKAVIERQTPGKNLFSFIESIE